MEELFAPWRIEWVTRDDPTTDDGGCVFCELAERPDEADALVVAKSEKSFVLCNNYPYNPGHVMVIPRTHEGDYAALDDETLLDHAKLHGRTLTALEDGLDADGCNSGMNLGSAAGGSITDHVHTHVVPRWHGDTNFMPIIGETTVIVEGLEATYERLHAAFAAQDGATVPDDGGAVRLGW